MATLHPYFRLARKLNAYELRIDAPTVGALLDQAVRQFGEEFKKDLRIAAVVVNGRNVNYLKGMNTPIGPADDVWLVLPSAGG